MRTVFFGTPSIAVPALRSLATISEVTAVVCQPDRPAGRGLRSTPPAVKVAARELGLVVHQPTAVRSGALAEWLRLQRADLALVMAYGRILPPDVLTAPRLGALNLHASLLPKYRGAAPINWAILHGESTTGISLMQMDAGMDTGPVFCQATLPIGNDTTAGELSEQLAELAAVVTQRELPRVVAGELRAIPQDAEQATHAPPLDPELRRIVWTESATDIVNLVRGLEPKPGAYTTVRSKILKIHEAARSDGQVLEPGRVAISETGQVLVGAGNGSVEIRCAQLEGKRAVGARDLINGRVVRSDDELGR